MSVVLKNIRLTYSYFAISVPVIIIVTVIGKCLADESTINLVVLFDRANLFEISF